MKNLTLIEREVRVYDDGSCSKSRRPRDPLFDKRTVRPDRSRRARPRLNPVRQIRTAHGTLRPRVYWNERVGLASRLYAHRSSVHGTRAEILAHRKRPGAIGVVNANCSGGIAPSA